jgi:hypothetical protein
MTVPIQRLQRNRYRSCNRPRAGFEAATRGVLALRATGVLSRIQVRNCSGLAICRHQRGDSRKCDHRALQPDGEHDDESDELALHSQKLSRLNAPRQIIGSILKGLSYVWTRHMEEICLTSDSSHVSLEWAGRRPFRKNKTRSNRRPLASAAFCTGCTRKNTDRHPSASPLVVHVRS